VSSKLTLPVTLTPLTGTESGELRSLSMHCVSDMDIVELSVNLVSKQLRDQVINLTDSLGDNGNLFVEMFTEYHD